MKNFQKNLEEISNVQKEFTKNQEEHTWCLTNLSGRMEKLEAFKDRTEGGKKRRSVILTPFDGNRADYKSFKQSVYQFLADKAGIAPSEVEDIYIWRNGPSVTVTFLRTFVCDKLLEDSRKVRNKIGNVYINPDLSEKARKKRKQKQDEREDAYLHSILKKRNLKVTTADQ